MKKSYLLSTALVLVLLVSSFFSPLLAAEDGDKETQIAEALMDKINVTETAFSQEGKAELSGIGVFPASEASLDAETLKKGAILALVLLDEEEGYYLFAASVEDVEGVSYATALFGEGEPLGISEASLEELDAEVAAPEVELEEIEGEDKLKLTLKSGKYFLTTDIPTELS